MLANQIPLLNLGARTNSLKAFLGKSAQEKQGAPDTEHVNKVINVVAATDPNDILSYPLRPEDVVPTEENDTSVVLSNIYSHNAWAILGFLVWPTSAHEDYDKNAWLINKLVKGYSEPRHECYKKPVKEDFSCADKGKGF
jgi:hypothetical protein